MGTEEDVYYRLSFRWHWSRMTHLKWRYSMPSLKNSKKGRSKETKPAIKAELNATAVIEILIQEVPAKIRSEGPEDDADDMNYPAWVGVIPIETRFGTAIPELTRQAINKKTCLFSRFFIGKFIVRQFVVKTTCLLHQNTNVMH